MNRLIVFVKRPVPGRVKTRLCPPLAPQQACSLYKIMARDVWRRARGVKGARTIAAVDGGGDASWLGRSVPWFRQAPGGLGSRLIGAFEKAFAEGARKVAIIGSDIPGLPPERLAQAFARLDSADLVLGPSYDGGYYLVALSQPRPWLFRGVPWSTEKVFARTRAKALARKLGVEVLPPFGDVDLPGCMTLVSEFFP
ncbi:MAG: TIGR04282 family arsenosugar biosynthesis glycosyltransferase [Elusimicrobia bacterium]|nr:TIGR04282 family arsenosugar biosynthesis glycosyltransferase [Elusimicrobiota bacterium]